MGNVSRVLVDERRKGMKTLHLGWLTVAFFILGVAHLIIWYPQLPETVPSHFNARGDADGWMVRGAFVAFMVIVHVMTVGFMGILAWMLKSLPVSLLNIPHREYWMHESRRDATLDYCRRILLITTMVTSIFLMALFQLTALVASERRDGIDPEMWWLLTAYLVLVLGTCLIGNRRFARIPETDQ